MDPASAQETLTAAALHTVVTSTGAQAIHELSPAEISELKKGRGREDSVRLAVKYHEVLKTVDEMRRILAKQTFRHTARVPQDHAVATLHPSQLQIVPYVATVPWQPPPPRTLQLAAIVLRFLQTFRITDPVWKAYRVILMCIYYTVVLAPLFALVAAFWIFIAGVVSVGSDPKMLIKAGFSLAWCLPDYLKWAGNQMIAAFVEKSRERIFR